MIFRVCAWELQGKFAVRTDFKGPKPFITMEKARHNITMTKNYGKITQKILFKFSSIQKFIDSLISDDFWIKQRLCQSSPCIISYLKASWNFCKVIHAGDKMNFSLHEERYFNSPSSNKVISRIFRSQLINSADELLITIRQRNKIKLWNSSSWHYTLKLLLT